MITAWCLGFVFSQNLAEVLLLRKGRTPHVRMWNGLGGKVEAHEEPAEAMHRECEEEASLKIHPEFWESVGSIRVPSGSRVYVFASRVADLSHKFPLATDSLVISEWPNDKPLAVPRSTLDRFQLAPHAEIMISAAALKLQNTRREQVHIIEVARF